MNRSAVALLLLLGLALAGCPEQPPVVVGQPVPPDGTPAAGSAAGGPPSLALSLEEAPGPVSFAGEAASASSRAYFVRVSQIRAGGEFVLLADEPVRVLVRAGNATRSIHDETFDFPSKAIQRFPVVDGEWAELPVADPVELDLELLCASPGSKTGETIARLPAVVKLPASAFGEDEPKTRELELGPIRLTEVGVFSRQKVEINGATATLELVSAPRRTTRDGAAAYEIEQAFGRSAGIEAPQAVHDWLASAGRTARYNAPRSLHGYVRRTLPELATTAEAVAAVASRAASAGPDTAKATRDDMDRRLAELRARLARETAGATAPVAAPAKPGDWSEPTTVPSHPARPDSFIGSTRGKTVCFVRIAAARIGGEFDDNSDEEIDIRAVLDGQSARLVYKELDLPSAALDDFTFEGDWVELPARDAFDVGVQVREDDLTEWEQVTHSKQPLHVVAADLPLDQEKELEVECTTIRLSEGTLIFRKLVEIPGAKATLAFVRTTPKLDKDDASRAAIRDAFAKLPASLATDAPLLEKAAAELEAVTLTVRTLAGRSLHLRVRRVAGDLGAILLECAAGAKAVAAADETALARDRAALADLAKSKIEDKDHLARVLALLGPVERTPAAFGARAAEIANVRPEADGALDEALEKYAGRLVSGKSGLGEARAKLDARFQELLAGVAAEK